MSEQLSCVSAPTARADGTPHTTREMCVLLLKEVEATAKTGPIISESRDVILSLLRATLARDYLICNHAGVSLDDVPKMIQGVIHEMNTMDDQILDIRKQKEKEPEAENATGGVL